MVREIIIPKENKAQIVEIREIENKDLAQQSEQQQKKLDKKQSNQPSIIESVKEAVLPVAHASDGDDDKDANIEHVDTIKESIQHDKDEVRRIKGEMSECEIL